MLTAPTQLLALPFAAFTFGLSLVRDAVLQFYYHDAERVQMLNAKFLPSELPKTIADYRPFLFDANWYLFALFLWKASAPYIHQVRNAATQS